MKILKNVLLLSILFLSTPIFAQVNYDISTIIIDEKFDNKQRLIARKIRSYGTQGEESLKVEIIVTPKNAVKELIVNEKKVMPLMFKEYRILTDYVISYADTERELEKPKANAVVKIVGQDLKEKLTETEKKMLLDTLKRELINDGILRDESEPFDFSMTGNYLFFNGNQQDGNIYNKYKQIYDRLCDIPLSKTTYFQITQTL